MDINTPLPFVSVIVPVYNDSKRLTLLLKSLKNQTYPKDYYEVIIADNGSSDDTLSVISNFIDETPDLFQLVVEDSKQSSYAARNKGIEKGSGDIFAFTDSDCIADTFWIEKGVEAFIQTENCGSVGGKIVFFFQNPQSPNLLELLDVHMFFDQEVNISSALFSVTANMFTSRRVFETTGLFNATLKSGGDTEWGNRVAKKKFELTFAEKAIIYHPARHILRQHLKKAKRIFNGQYVLYYSRLSKKQQLIKLLQNESLPPVRRIVNTFLYEKKETFIQTISFILLIIIFKYLNFYWKLKAILFSSKD